LDRVLVIIEIGITSRRQKSILPCSNSQASCLTFAMRNNVATSLTVIPSENNSAARINIGGFMSEEDQLRIPMKSPGHSEMMSPR
jgi:hypothetical protein